MGEDVVVVQKSEGEYGRPTNLPKSFIEALSAIQEQSFIDSTRDDPEDYAKSFTLQNRLHFFWAGFSGGAFDVTLTAVGMFLFSLAMTGILPMFGRWNPGAIDLVFAFLLATFPYLATFILAVRIFSQISGTISRIMALWLSIGFFVGCSLLSLLYFIVGHAAAYDFADSVYLFLARISAALADLYWDSVRDVLVKASWREAVLAHFCGLFVCLIYLGKILELKARRKGAVLET